MKTSTTKKLKKFSVAIFWIVIWQIFALLINEEILIVSPFKVFLKTLKNLQDKTFYLAIFNTSWKILMGFLLGLFIGVILSFISYKFKTFKDFIYPLVQFIKSVPVVSFIMLLLMFLNSKYLSVFIPAIMSFAIFYTNILEGLLSIDYKILEMAKIFSISTKNKLKYIYLHSLKPYLYSGASLAMGISFKAGLSAEVIGIADKTIGRMLYESKVYLDIANLFSYTFVAMIIAIIFEKIILFILRRFL